MLVKPDSSWDTVADVLIIGYGMAGAVAAITAREKRGTQVLVLDKQPQDGFYTTSSLSGGIFISSSDVKKTVQYMEGLNRISGDIPWTEPEITQVWAEYIADNKEWIQRLGGNVHLFATGGEHPEIPGCESFQLWHYNGAGTRMMGFLYEQVSRRGIEVRHNTAAKKLLTNLDGEVVGVRVETGEGRQMDIGATRAVILACGGFEFDERMKLNYLKVYPAYFYGSPANTGDGIRMALEVGADLWHMNCCSARAVAKFPEYPWSFTLDFGGKGWTARITKNEGKPEPAGYIVVDRHGKRFTSENFKLHCLYYELGLFDSQRLEYPRIPSYWIFDHNRMEAGALPLTIAGPAGPHQLYPWSQDNSKELEKGWIISGRTVRELARKLEMPPDALHRTVNTYNRYCYRGHDPEFKRRPTDLIPLERPPFYAVRLWPGGANTQGGPRRNTRSQILNTDGNPIPRLYGAGELGAVYGMLYPSGGGNLAECIAFGRIAGEHAAREEPSQPGATQ